MKTTVSYISFVFFLKNQALYSTALHNIFPWYKYSWDLLLLLVCAFGWVEDLIVILNIKYLSKSTCVQSNLYIMGESSKHVDTRKVVPTLKVPLKLFA